MSRRDTIIIAVLINACLLIVLFATAVTKKEELPYSSKNEKVIQKAPPVVHVEDVERAVVQETSYVKAPTPLTKPSLPSVTPPTPAPAPTQVASAPKPKEPEVKEVPKKAAPVPTHIQITVKRGDYLDKIARENQTKVDEIMKLNNLTSTQLRIGQVLKIPASDKKTSTKTVAPQVPKQYTVKSGDTLWQIAKNHNMQVSDLLKLNHMSSEHANRLQPGDTLLVR